MHRKGTIWESWIYRLFLAILRQFLRLFCVSSSLFRDLKRGLLFRISWDACIDLVLMCYIELGINMSRWEISSFQSRPVPFPILTGLISNHDSSVHFANSCGHFFHRKNGSNFLYILKAKKVIQKPHAYVIRIKLIVFDHDHKKYSKILCDMNFC